MPGAHSVQHFALLSHDPPFWPTHPKSVLFGHRCKSHGGGDGGGSDGGGDGGGGESVDAAMDEQPQAFACLHPHPPMEPPHGFTHSVQHLSLLNHWFPTQPKPSLF